MSRRTKVILVVILLLLIGGGAFWIWNKYTGRFKIGANAIIGCQNSRAISNFFGRPGTNLVSYNLFGHDILVNEKMPPFLDSIQREVNEANTGYSFDDVQSYNYRSKRGGGGQSLHSWGIAIDINPSRNPYQLGNYGAPQTDIPGVIIDIFKKYGLAWGGDWPGERDSMHFEWYGAEIYGDIIDSVSKQKVIDAAAFINVAGAPVIEGSYEWVLEAKVHEVVVKAKGYEESKFSLELFCFQSRQMDITLNPLPDNIPGSISGKVTLAENRAPVIPATIYLDGEAVGATNVRGEYIIPNVRSGKHKVEAKILFFPGDEIETSEMKPGEHIQNIDVSIGKT